VPLHRPARRLAGTEGEGQLAVAEDDQSWDRATRIQREPEKVGKHELTAQKYAAWQRDNAPGGHTGGYGRSHRPVGSGDRGASWFWVVASGARGHAPNGAINPSHGDP